MTTPNRKIRWMPCINKSEETAPPFALMSLLIQRGFSTLHGTALTPPGAPGPSPFTPFNQIVLQQQDVWTVTKSPGVHSQDLSVVPSLLSSDAAMYVCNGPGAIEPGKPGMCTQDWPARVRTDSSEGLIEIGQLCGPRIDSWEIHPGGTVFVNQGYDPAAPLADKPAIFEDRTSSRHSDWTLDRINTMWISPGGLAADSANAATRGSQNLTYDPGQTLHILHTGRFAAPWPTKDPAGRAQPWLTRDPFANVTRRDDALAPDPPDPLVEDDTAMQVNLAGLYLVGFQAALTSDDAPLGSTLRLELQVDEVETGYSAFRTQSFESDPYSSPNVMVENVAFTGIVDLDAGQILKVINTSGYSVFIPDMQFWVCRINVRNDQSSRSDSES